MKKLIILLTFTICPFVVKSQQAVSPASTVLQNTTISGKWFLGFNYNEGTGLTAFNIKRGYITLKTKLSDIISVRYTQDITVDKEGGDMGDVKVRLKYLYLKADLKNIDLLKYTSFEFGLIHRPWIDFEQKLTSYRVQGNMYTERYNITSSADFGVMYSGLIGGKINEEYQNRVSKNYPGKYGSFAFGIYNGGGYHAVEKNSNKTVEGRLTLRPLSEFFPGLQLSYAFAYGKGNTPLNNSDFKMNLLHVSTESKYHFLTLQYYTGVGGYSDKHIDDLGNSYKNDGFSFFGEFRFPKTPFAIFSRYDHFTSHQQPNNTVDTYIAGLTYRFMNNKVLFNFDQQNNQAGIVRIYELLLEVNF